MLLGRIEEARTVYLAHRGDIAQDTIRWETAVTDDFAGLRKIGLATALMDEIEKAFATSH